MLSCVCLYWQFSPGGRFVPKGTFGSVGRQLWLSWQVHVTGVSLVEVRDAAKYPTTHRTAPEEDYLSQTADSASVARPLVACPAALWDVSVLSLVYSARPRWGLRRKTCIFLHLWCPNVWHRVGPQERVMIGYGEDELFPSSVTSEHVEKNKNKNKKQSFPSPGGPEALLISH